MANGINVKCARKKNLLDASMRGQIQEKETERDRERTLALNDTRSLSVELETANH